MLDTKFERVLGDIGNPASFDFPVLYHKVEKANVRKIVSSGPIDDLLPQFVAAAQSLERSGAHGITTSCGFLSLAQQQLQDAVGVPLVTSSLFLVPHVYAELEQKPVVIVTANSAQLSHNHLRAAGIAPEWTVHVLGMESCPAFKKSILSDGDPDAVKLDPEAIETELVEICQRYLAVHSDVAGFVFECTNLQPYANAVRQKCKRPIWGIDDVIAQLSPAFARGVK